MSAAAIHGPDLSGSALQSAPMAADDPVEGPMRILTTPLGVVVGGGVVVMTFLAFGFDRRRRFPEAA